MGSGQVQGRRGSGLNTAPPKQQQLILNVAPLDFPEVEVEAGLVPYESRDQLRALRRHHNQTHIFRREGDEIICIATSSGPSVPGTDPRTLNLRQHPELVAALARNALLNYLNSRGAQIRSYDPMRFSLRTSLLAGCLPSGLAFPDWLAVRTSFQASVRVVYREDADPIVGLVLDVRTSRHITAPCSDLLTQKINVTDRYVGRYVQDDDTRLAPHFELLGRVRQVTGGRLHLDDTREDVDSIEASEAFLEPRWETFYHCLERLLGAQAAAVHRRLDQKLLHIRSGPGRLEELERMRSHLACVPPELAPGISFSIGSFLSEGDGQAFPTVGQAPRPIYILDPTGAQTDTWNDGGLTRYGPYDAGHFTPTRPRICVICQASRKGQVERFLRKFLEGIPARGVRHWNPDAMLGRIGETRWFL